MNLHIKNYLNFLIIIDILFMVSCGKDKSVSSQLPEIVYSNDIIIDAVDTILAGSSITVYIRNQTSENQSYFLFQHPFGTAVFMNPNKNSQILVDSTLTSKAGICLLQFFENNRKLKEKILYIRPNIAINSIETYIGPRSIITGSNQEVMTIPIPTDIFDNPMENGTSVFYNIVRPNNLEEHYEKKTNHLLTYHYTYPQTEIGKTLIGITCGTANSKEKEFSEEAGWAVAIKLDSINYQPIADDRQFFIVKTRPILDKLNHLVADGTAVVFYMRDEQKQLSRYLAQTINGVAEVKIQHPVDEGKQRIFAISCGKESEEVILYFNKNIANFKVEFDEYNQEIIAGPILANLKQYIADGTEVKFDFYKNDKFDFSKSASSQNGVARLKLKEAFLEKVNYQIIVTAQNTVGKINIFIDK